MTQPQFQVRADPLSLRDIVDLTGAMPAAGVALGRRIAGIAALEEAAPQDLAFLDNPKYVAQLAATRAGACLVAERFAPTAPSGVAILVSRAPYRAFVAVARKLFPHALRPSSLFAAEAVAPGASVHPTARLEAGVRIDPGAIIGPHAELGAGTVVCAGAAIGPEVRIGRNCSVGAAATVMHALLGDRVILHPGCRVGQDGFGYLMDAGGHQKVPQTGRVIIQDDVEIGANSTIDRGANRDTVIGEGTKIDNLVQVGHNVSIGRHCLIVAQTGLSGSVTLGDFVVLGARVGVNNHISIGERAQIAAISIVNDDVPPGARWGGTPAKPTRQWFREMKMLEQLARKPREARPGPGSGSATLDDGEEK